MKAGFYTIMAAQFFSSLADNALLSPPSRCCASCDEPAWMTPALKQCFVISYVVLAPLVGAFADSMPKGRVMLITNGIKIVGCSLMLFDAASAARLRGRRPRRRRLFAGEVRHPDRAPAAAAARRRQRLDRGHDRRLDHPRRAARRRADQRARCPARCSRFDMPHHRHRHRHAAGGGDRGDHGALRRSPRSSTGTSRTPASTTGSPSKNPIFLIREFAHCVRAAVARQARARSRSRRRRCSGAPARRCSSSCIDWAATRARLQPVAGVDTCRAWSPSASRSARSLAARFVSLRSAVNVLPIGVADGRRRHRR